MQIPKYWKGNLEDIENVLKKVKKGNVRVLCKSPGNRPVYLVEYGKKNQWTRTANLCSALNAGSVKYYADKTAPDCRPCVLLVGATHGGEWESIVAINNLISLLETGTDLAGNRYDAVAEAAEGINLLLIPCLNPDGRARIPLETMAGQTFEKFRYYCQGTWKDGSLCGWPNCMKVHPIKEESGFLGGYFNDDGVNILRDNPFLPMAEETKALLGLADAYVPDLTIHLHGGDNTSQHFCADVSYMPEKAIQKLRALNDAVYEATKAAGLDPDYFKHHELKRREGEEPPFGLCQAHSAICGEPCVVYESNQGLACENSFSMEEIYAHHWVLFETAFRFVKREIPV